MTILGLIFLINPNNEKVQELSVDSITNRIQIGSLAGNRNLEFGVKNILEEFLQDKGYDINPNSLNKLKIEIIYLDVLKTKSNLSVFHNDKEEVVIRMKANLFTNGKKGKDIIVQESSSEISMSTLLIDNGGKFNQQSLSNSIKKACESIVNEIEKQQK